ncbi:MAG: rhodanese-like domain-containing protein [Granulosicoccus sp.]
MIRVLPTLLLVVGLASQLAQALEEPEGYRTELYDDTVPDTLTGAVRIGALEVLQLQQEENAVVVDVVPEQRQPDELPQGQIWMPVPHKGIAGAIWLPDVGFGVLSETTESYFRGRLRAATDGQLARAVVFYCRADCWMSWNAAKRALTFGYTRVYWFADGIDDWRFEGLEVEVLKPAPGQRQAEQADPAALHSR